MSRITSQHHLLSPQHEWAQRSKPQLRLALVHHTLLPALGTARLARETT